MTLTVRPDPREPAGGYAILELPAGALSGDSVSVTVQDAFAGKWLGPGGAWRGEPHAFGPCPVERDGDVTRIRIGPDIVDHVEEYATLKISLGPFAAELIWPDDVPPRPPAAAPGTIHAPHRHAAEPAAPAMEAVEEPVADEPELDPGGAARQMDWEDAPEDAAEPDQDSVSPLRSFVVPFALTLILLAAVFAALRYWPDEAPVPTAPAREISETRAVADPCAADALATAGGGFDATGRALRACAGKVDPDVALRLIEDAAARGDGAALQLFGMLYDGEALDEPIETGIGLSFGDDPAKAAEYYARAAGAGAEGAQARLEQVCRRLAEVTGTLEKGAFDDFCR